MRGLSDVGEKVGNVVSRNYRTLGYQQRTGFVNVRLQAHHYPQESE
jgi:hypothetical protein